jgi:endonuclease YncB( thermonuclease family)
VTDGDTFRVLYPSGASGSVRVLGIDAAELHPTGSDSPQCYATEAKQAVSAALAGTSVSLVPDAAQPSPDRYGRELSYVQTASGTDLAELLLSQGYVRVYNAYPVSRTAHYLELQAAAKASGSGGWSACGWTEAGR